MRIYVATPRSSTPLPQLPLPRLQSPLPSSSSAAPQLRTSWRLIPPSIRLVHPKSADPTWMGTLLAQRRSAYPDLSAPHSVPGHTRRSADSYCVSLHPNTPPPPPRSPTSASPCAHPNPHCHSSRRRPILPPSPLPPPNPPSQIASVRRSCGAAHLTPRPPPQARRTHTPLLTTPPLAHALTGPDLCFNARSRDLVNDASSKGLPKKATAPAASARARALSFGNAVMKMIGMLWPAFSIWPCSSSPFRPGICRSVIRQETFSTLPNDKNCSADAKVKEVYPRASTRSAIASLTNESSSIIAITILFATIVFRLFSSRTHSSLKAYWLAPKPL